MWCPRCEQGEIVRAGILNTGKEVYVCKECEATWFSAREISISTFVDFGTYMEAMGLRPLWDELDVEDKNP